MASVKEQRQTISSGFDAAANAFRHLGERLAGNNGTIGANLLALAASGAGKSAAERIEKVSQYVREHELAEIRRDTEAFARRSPALFVGIAFVAGFALTRFLRSAPDETSGIGGRASFSSGVGM